MAGVSSSSFLFSSQFPATHLAVSNALLHCEGECWLGGARAEGGEHSRAQRSWHMSWYPSLPEAGVVGTPWERARWALYAM